MTRKAPPLVHMLQAAGLRRIELASCASVDLKTIAKLCRGDYIGMKVVTLARVSLALGCAPAELVPQLARRPRKGLLYDRGVFKLKQ